MGRDVRLDRRDQLPYMPEDAAPEPPGGEVAEPVLNEIKPRTARGNNVLMEERMAYWCLGRRTECDPGIGAPCQENAVGSRDQAENTSHLKVAVTPHP